MPASTKHGSEKARQAVNPRIKGVIVPPLTLFDRQGDIDPVATKLLVDYLIRAGVGGLFPGGTTGEGILLSTDERRQLAELVVEAAAGRVPVIIHSGAITTAETLALTEHAQTVGAVAAAIIPPYYFHHTDAALITHFETVANRVPDFPIYLYNNPGVAHNHLKLSVVSALVERCPNIVGMKDSSGNLDYMASTLKMRGGDFNVASGSDAQILASQAIGCDACVSGNANVVPELVVALFAAAAAGRLVEARRLQDQLNTVRQLLEDGANLSLFKGVLARRGLPASPVRAPLLNAPDSLVQQGWEGLRQLDIPFSVN